MIWVFAQVGRLILSILNVVMLPQNRTGQPNPNAIFVWGLANFAIFTWLAYVPDAYPRMLVAAGVGVLHFLIVVTVLLVISEENDIWSGYVRYDRSGSPGTNREGRDYRTFKRGKIVKSLPLIAISAVSYLVFLAVALKGLHATNNILTIRYSPSVPIWSYLVTVAAQIPIVDTLMKWAGLHSLMEFQGVTGTAIKLLIHVTNITIIVGTFNSYFRQKSQIRRLSEGLASARGDIPFLQLQAQRAPDEIKSAIIAMAVEHPEAHTRRRAMAVAPYLSILTFPHTMVHHLHNERIEQNKRRALAVSIEIIRNNVAHLQPAFIRLLRSKIDIQLKTRRQQHTQHILDMLMELRGMLPPGQSTKAAD